MNPKKICLLSAGHITSNPRLVKEADALHAAGFEILVLGWQNLDRVAAMDAEIESLRSWKAHQVKWSKLDRLKTHLPSRWADDSVRQGNRQPEVCAKAIAPWYKQYLHEIVRFQPDLILAHTLPSLAIAALAQKCHGFRFSFDLEDYHPTEQADERRNELARRILENFIHQAVYVSGAAPHISKKALEEFKLKEVTTILNCFPLESLPDRKPRVPNGLSLYWFSQTLGLDRGLEDAMRACSQLKGNFELNMRGSITQEVRKRILSMARECNIQDRCHIHSWCKCVEIFQKIAEHDVGLALERTSPQNRDICITNKILHYPLAGLAVVASETTGQSWVMSQMPGAGFTYKAGDVQRLKNGLQHWLDHPDELTKAKQAARKAAETQFCWEKEAPKFLNLVDKALSS